MQNQAQQTNQTAELINQMNQNAHPLFYSFVTFEGKTLIDSFLTNILLL
jgi:hypothetical protein